MLINNLLKFVLYFVFLIIISDLDADKRALIFNYKTSLFVKDHSEMMTADALKI